MDFQRHRPSWWTRSQHPHMPLVAVMQPVQCDPIHGEQAQQVTTASHWSHRTHRTQVPATTPPSQEVGRAFAAGRSVVQPPSHPAKLQNGVRLWWRQRVTPQEATTQAERIVGSGRHQRPIPAQYHSIRRTQAQSKHEPVVPWQETKSRLAATTPLPAPPSSTLATAAALTPQRASR